MKKQLKAPVKRSDQIQVKTKPLEKLGEKQNDDDERLEE